MNRNPYFEWTPEQLAKLVPGARCTYYWGGEPLTGEVVSLEDGAFAVRDQNGTTVVPPAAIDPASVRPPKPTARDVVRAMFALVLDWRERDACEDLSAGACIDELSALRARFEDLL